MGKFCLMLQNVSWEKKVLENGKNMVFMKEKVQMSTARWTK